MNSSINEEAILEDARYAIFRHLLAVIVSLIVFGAIGIVGNSFAFAFYAFKSKPSTTVRLIACLAMVDLIVCVEFIPNIVEMWVNVKYTANVMCKLAHFFGLWTVACSGLILWVVAIDRHRKICFPFGKQVTLVTTKYAVIAIVVTGCILSVRNFANFDSVVVYVKSPDSNITVEGHYCTTRDDSGYIVSVTIFTAIDFLLMLMVWITLAGAYSHIIYTIYRLKRKRKGLQNKKGVNNTEKTNPSSGSEVDESSTQTQENLHQLKTNIDGLEGHGVTHPYIGRHHGNDTLSSNDCEDSVQSNNVITEPASSTEISSQYNRNTNECDKKLPKKVTASSKHHPRSTLKKMFHKIKRKKYNSAKCPVERNLTFKMLTVSLVFIICFTPYFIVKILMREVLKSGEEYELSLLSQIAIRLPYMNSVFNPIVYCVFNRQFRIYIRDAFKTIISTCFSKTRYLFQS